jgi:negative regulator of flagellin synthesis FlgM
MKIGSTPDTCAASADLSVRSGARPAGGPASASAPAGASTDQVDVSAMGTQMSAAAGGSADFDSAKVDAIRQAIREGRFTVNPGAIADRLIADAAALLGPRTPRH